MLCPSMSLFIKCWKYHGLVKLSPWPDVTEQQDICSDTPWSFTPRKALSLHQGDQGCRVTPERLPVEIFLGHLTPASSHSVPLQQTRKFGISCLPKHTVTCCEYVLFVLCNLARSCYSSLQEPTSSHFSQPGSLDLLEPMPASLLLCKERMLMLVCNLCWSATSASDEKVPPNYYRRRNKRPQEPPEFLLHLGKSPCPRLQHRAVLGLLLIKL